MAQANKVAGEGGGGGSKEEQRHYYLVTVRYKVWTLVVGGDLTDLAKGLGGDSSNHP